MATSSFIIENSLIMWGLQIFSCLPKHSCYKLLKHQQFINDKVTRMYFQNNKQNTIPDSKYLLPFIIILPSSSKIKNFTLKQCSRDIGVWWVYNLAIIQSYNYNEILVLCIFWKAWQVFSLFPKTMPHYIFSLFNNMLLVHEVWCC